jgi:hypothetical protein
MLVMLCLMSALQTSAPASQPADCSFPPPPEWGKSTPDYFEWVADRIVRNDSLAENGAPLFLELFGKMEIPEDRIDEELGFFGFRLSHGVNEVAVPAPWNPKDHPDWEESHEKSREALVRYVRATEKPFVLYPFFFEPGVKPEERLLQHAVTPYLPYLRVYSSHLSEMAWRAPNGEVSADALVSACGANLRAARQLERIPLIRSHLAAGGMRVQAYEDLRFALHHNVFRSPRDIQACLEMLETCDPPPPPLRCCLAGEAAVCFDMLYGAADPSRPPLGRAHFRDSLSLVRTRQIDAPSTAAHLVEYLQEAANFSERPYARESRVLASNLDTSGAELNMLTKMAFPAFGRLYFLDRRVQAERAGTRLLIHLHAWKHAHGRWPGSLDELRGSAAEPFVTDPFGNKPFHYRVESGKAMLYSVAADTDDNQGNHDWQWGDLWKGHDYVLWPVPDRPQN